MILPIMLSKSHYYQISRFKEMRKMIDIKDRKFNALFDNRLNNLRLLIKF